MGVHNFIRDNEIHYEVAKIKDKDFITIEGATHGIIPYAEYEKTKGAGLEFGAKIFDYMTKWVNARFRFDAPSTASPAAANDLNGSNHRLYTVSTS
jgi:hypothetical protein